MVRKTLHNSFDTLKQKTDLSIYSCNHSIGNWPSVEWYQGSRLEALIIFRSILEHSGAFWNILEQHKKDTIVPGEPDKTRLGTRAEAEKGRGCLVGWSACQYEELRDLGTKWHIRSKGRSRTKFLLPFGNHPVFAIFL